MQPFFSGDIRKQRRINLGGASAVATHEDVIQNVRAIRNERLLQTRMKESAVKIQASWRGYEERKELRGELRRIFDSNPTNIDAVRCLVMLKDDEARLAIWARWVVGTQSIDDYLKGLDYEGCTFLFCRLLHQLLTFVAQDPSTENVVVFLSLIDSILNSSLFDPKTLIQHLVSHGYYPLLKQATEKITPENKKTSASLPLITPLYLFPFKIVKDDPELYQTCFIQTFLHILVIPLLPYRLPVQSLAQLSASIPFYDIHLLSSSLNEFLELPLQDRLHLLSNLATFIPPRYKLLPLKSLATYLQILSKLMVDLPITAFEEPASPNARKQFSGQESDDSEDEDDAQQDAKSSLQSPVQKYSIDIDVKTRARIRTLGSVKHVCSLISVIGNGETAKTELFVFLISLFAVWEPCRDDVLSALLASGGGLIRELYRNYVRSSPLGKLENDAMSFIGSESAATWPFLIIFVDVYTYALRTMGDDEFFASRNQKFSTLANRNPLTVDEVIALSKQVLNIAFTLYWKDTFNTDQRVPNTTCTWESVRDKMTILLQAIHARDSRRPFTPPDHWLFTSQIDMTMFVEAAILKDESLVDTKERVHGRSKGYLAKISPHLGILSNIPFAIPFKRRVEILHRLMRKDTPDFLNQDQIHITVRRGQVARDGFDQLYDSDLRQRIRVSFIDQFGDREAGIDGGGLFKEFFTSLCKEVFDTDRGLWLVTKQQELYPNPHSYAKESSSLRWYRFIGRLLGKAIFEGILVDAAFAGFFLAKWLDRQSFLDDLASLDEELYNGLIFLKNYDGNLQDLSLTFAVTEEEFGVTTTIDLIPDGSNIPVTQENRLQYIYFVCYHHLVQRIRKQSDAFFKGLSEIIDSNWLRMFNQQELQILIGGVDTLIDLDDLRENTNYGGSLKEDSPYVEKFWKVVETFNHEQRKALLRFATSCSRPPLLGFKELNPKFCINGTENSQDRLPSASTCFNILKLPIYDNEELLRKKLLQAITSGAGFDLS